MAKYLVIYDDGNYSEILGEFCFWIEAKQLIEDEVMEQEGEFAKEENYIIKQILQ